MTALSATQCIGLLQDSGGLDELRNQVIAEVDQGDTDFSKLRLRVQDLVAQRIATLDAADVADVRKLKNVFVALKQEVDSSRIFDDVEARISDWSSRDDTIVLVKQKLSEAEEFKIAMEKKRLEMKKERLLREEAEKRNRELKLKEEKERLERERIAAAAAAAEKAKAEAAAPVPQLSVVRTSAAPEPDALRSSASVGSTKEVMAPAVKREKIESPATAPAIPRPSKPHTDATVKTKKPVALIKKKEDKSNSSSSASSSSDSDSSSSSSSSSTSSSSSSSSSSDSDSSSSSSNSSAASTKSKVKPSKPTPAAKVKKPRPPPPRPAADDEIELMSTTAMPPKRRRKEPNPDAKSRSKSKTKTKKGKEGESEAKTAATGETAATTITEKPEKPKRQRKKKDTTADDVALDRPPQTKGKRERKRRNEEAKADVDLQPPASVALASADVAATATATASADAVAATAPTLSAEQTADTAKAVPAAGETAGKASKRKKSVRKSEEAQLLGDQGEPEAKEAVTEQKGDAPASKRSRRKGRVGPEDAPKWSETGAATATVPQPGEVAVASGAETTAPAPAAVKAKEGVASENGVKKEETEQKKRRRRK